MPCALDVVLEGLLVPQPFPELDDQPPAVEVAREVEEEGLDASLAAAVVRVHHDRDGRAPILCRARVDPIQGHPQLRPDVEVRGREAERPAAGVAGDDDPLDFDWTAERGCSRLDVAGTHKLPDSARGDVLEQRDGTRIEAEALEGREVALTGTPEPEIRARDDDLSADRPEELVCELLRLEPGHVQGDLDNERRLDTKPGEELESPLERGQELDSVAEGGARVRIECDDGRLRSGGEQGLDHATVAEVHAVESSERDCARLGAELGRRVRDLHASAESASAGGIIRSGSAWAMSKGPTCVLLKLT